MHIVSQITLSQECFAIRNDFFAALSSKVVQNWLNKQKSAERVLTAAQLFPTLPPTQSRLRNNTVRCPSG